MPVSLGQSLGLIPQVVKGHQIVQFDPGLIEKPGNYLDIGNGVEYVHLMRIPFPLYLLSL
jgi:hypothetical protein